MSTDLSDLRKIMEKTFEVVVVDVATIRTGRVSPTLVEDVVCSVYDKTQNLKLKELASIAVENAQTLAVTPWDQTLLDEIFKSLLEADLGATPIKDSNLIRVKLPLLTTERRQEYVKLLNIKLEAGRRMVRQGRRDMIVGIRQELDDKQINEDEKFRLEKEVQKITDEFIARIDELGKKKEKELLSV